MEAWRWRYLLSCRSSGEVAACGAPSPFASKLNSAHACPLAPHASHVDRGLQTCGAVCAWQKAAPGLAGAPRLLPSPPTWSPPAHWCRSPLQPRR